MIRRKGKTRHLTGHVEMPAYKKHLTDDPDLLHNSLHRSLSVVITGSDILNKIFVLGNEMKNDLDDLHELKNVS